MSLEDLSCAFKRCFFFPSLILHFKKSLATHSGRTRSQERRENEWAWATAMKIIAFFCEQPLWNYRRVDHLKMALTLTKLAGNHPSSSSICPHHQSLLEASRTLMTSPALNASSRSAMVTWSHTASALTTEPPLINWIKGRKKIRLWIKRSSPGFYCQLLCLSHTNSCKRLQTEEPVGQCSYMNENQE